MKRLLDAAERRIRLWNRRRLRGRELARVIAYPRWCERYDTLDAPTLAALQARMDALPAAPVLTLVLAVGGDSAIDALDATLHSLHGQLWRHWQLTLDLSGADTAQARWVDAAAAADTRVGTTPRAADWTIHTGAGDIWRPHALLLLAEALQRTPAPLLVYADHDRLDAGGVRTDPAFKPDWNPELLLSHDCIGATAVFAAAHLQRHAPGARGRHDRLLAFSETLTAADVVHIPHVLLHTPAQADADPAAVAAHLERQRLAARTQATPHGVRVHWALPDPAPLVSVIVPTRNALKLLRTCVHGVLHGTDYPALELIVVDNGSDDPACLRFLQGLASDPRVRVLRDDSPFNYAALNNAAVRSSRGSVVVLLNNDIEVLDPGWLREMVPLALQPAIGAVGARLLHGDRSLQHAGVVLGVGGAAGHVFKLLDEDAGGHLDRVHRLQDWSAVTAACLAVRREAYDAVGGLDAAAFAVAFNDVDFCLKLQAAGLRNVYTPHATLLHHESVSRGRDVAPAKKARFDAEEAALQQRWRHVIRRDPAWNPNLTLVRDHGGLADPPRVSLLRPWWQDDDGSADEA